MQIVTYFTLLLKNIIIFATEFMQSKFQQFNKIIYEKANDDVCSRPLLRNYFYCIYRL